jgi:hypothetical protein
MRTKTLFPQKQYATMKPMKISSFRPVFLMLSVTTMIALGRAADSSSALPPPWQHQDIGSGQVGKKVPAVPVE